MASHVTPPKPPAVLGKRGRRFWRTTVADFELNEAETELLVEICTTLDRLDSLNQQVNADGQMVTGSAGQKVLHPAVGEARQQRLTLSRLLGQLALPGEDGKSVATPRQASARQAAAARWSGVATEASRKRGGA